MNVYDMYFTYNTHSENDTLCVSIYFTDDDTQYTLDDLFHLWIEYYESQTEFSFIFHTKEITKIPSLWVALKMAMFLYSLKYRYPEKHYLTHSRILIQNPALQRLLEVIFAIQLPVAPVYIYHSDTYDETLAPSAIITP